MDPTWRVPDALWERIQPLLPVEPPKLKGGRPRMPDRQALDAIFYVLRTGIQWKALPRELGAASTVHDRFVAWRKAKVFAAGWRAALQEYDELHGLEWAWQAMDGAVTKAPLGGGATGPNPTDRGKTGTKRSLLTDGAGIPIGLAIAGANRNDMKLVKATLASMPLPGPAPTLAAPQGMCLDKGYDSAEVAVLLAANGYTAHIRRRGEERQAKRDIPGYRARRWVVERTHSWMNRFRRLLIRWEKDEENYLAMLQLACTCITYQRAGVFG